MVSTHPKINLSVGKYEDEEGLRVRKRIKTSVKSIFRVQYILSALNF